MRRKDKEITDFKEIESIIKKNYICRIALSDNNLPYIIPMNYGYKNKAIYFHSAKEGTKLTIIKKNPKACFEITEEIKIIQSKEACSFGTKYRSVIGRGKIKIIDEGKEKIDGLNVIMKQLTSRDNWNYSEESLKKILVLKLEIDEVRGKKSGY